MNPWNDSDRDLQQLAFGFVLIELLARLYLVSADPTQAAADHRASLRKLLADTPIPTMDPVAAAKAKELLGEKIDEIVEQAGRAASDRAADEGR